MTTKTYETVPQHAVAFLGLGVMGYPMAGHLARAGHRVIVYNRTAKKAQQWTEEFGGRSATTPREAAQGAQIVFSCVGNDDDLRSVMLGDDGAFAGMAKDAIAIDNTTASARVARELHGVARSRGQHFIDAPVSGGQAGAVNGALTVMCGGDLAPFERARRSRLHMPSGLVPANGRRTARQDGQPDLHRRAGRRALPKASHFGQAAGLDMKLVLEVIGKGAARAGRWTIAARR